MNGSRYFSVEQVGEWVLNWSCYKHLFIKFLIILTLRITSIVFSVLYCTEYMRIQ